MVSRVCGYVVDHASLEASTSVAAPSPFVTSRSITCVQVDSYAAARFGFSEIQSLNLAFLQEVLDGLAVALGSSVKRRCLASCNPHST